ncbi:MAG: tetratricopeptide repeat protein [Desulfobacterales bacterium]|nr:tetratricopeptide repeat protein [Desulfobacterales bacterium]
MKRTKKEAYIEKYEKNLILLGLFAFIIFGVMFLTFLLPRIYNIYPEKKEGKSFKNNLNQSTPEINYRSGRESIKQNNYSSALDYFQKAIESEPDNIDYLTELATTHYKLKNYDEAIKGYEKIVRLNPDNISCYNRIGNIYWIKKDFERAEFYFKKAIELDPSLIVSYNNLALMLDENGKKEEAIEILNQGIIANSDNVELRYYLKIIDTRN